MTGSVQILRAEWLELLARPKGLVIKLLYPLVIGVPLVFLAPPRYGSMAVTLLVATVSGLGTAAVLGAAAAYAAGRRVLEAA